jgi:hypothetical protein
MGRKECFCNEQFDVKACSVQGIYKTSDVLAHDPESLACTNTVNVISVFEPSNLAKLTCRSGRDCTASNPTS